MITPSVYDCPGGKIREGDFHDYLGNSGSKFKYNSNREPLRKESRTKEPVPKLGLGLELSVISNDVLGSCRDEPSGLRSKSNTARDRDENRNTSVAGRSGSFASSM